MTNQTIPPLNEPPTPNPLSNLRLEAINDNLRQHLVVNSEVFAALRAGSDLERRHHVELRKRPVLAYWWESIWFALFRVLLSYVDRRTNLHGEWQRWVTARPDRYTARTVFDETEAEHAERLLGHIRTQNYLRPEIPVHESHYIRPGEGVIFTGRASEPPTSVLGVTVDPAD